MEKQELFSQLKKEHALIQKLLVKISASIMTEDLGGLRQLLLQFNEEAGPHFRFEEDAVYPALVDVYFPEYIVKLYTDHDLAIARYNQLKNLFNRENITISDYTEGLRHVKMMIHYIANCETIPLSKMPLNEQQIRKLSLLYKKSRAEKLNLISWSDSKRRRKQLFFN